MKRSKVAVSVLLVLMFCLTLLAACNSDSGGGSSSPSASASTEPSASSPNASSSGTPSPGVPSPEVSSALVEKPPESVDVVYAESVNVIVDDNTIIVIDPFNSGAGATPHHWVFNMIYDTLVIDNFDGNYSPGLALEYETTDWQTFTFYLRDDVTFHNGDKFTAEDVANTINRSKEAVGSTAAARWANVDTVNVIDPYKVEIVLSRVNVDFLYMISQPSAGIVNDRAIAADSENGSWIGTGPWIVSDFMTRDYVTLVRNDNYWGELPITKVLTLRHVPEVSTRLMQLQNGEADVCFKLDNSDLPDIIADTDHYATFSTVWNNSHALGFNMDDPICGNYNFRMAVASAIDRTEIVLAACGEFGVPESGGTLYGYAMEFRNNDIPIVPYDIDKAKEYLEASPYNGETIEIATAIPENITASEVIQQQLAKIGITTTINQMDAPGLTAYTRYGENQAQMTVAVVPFNINSSSLRNMYYTGAASNNVSYSNPEVDEIFDEISTVTDKTERGNLYRHVQELIAQDPPRFGLMYVEAVAAGVKGVGGLVITSDPPRYDLTYIYKIIS